MKSQSKFGLIKIHYEPHAPSTGKSETHTEYLVGITEERI
jgi:hypothetical protein